MTQTGRLAASSNQGKLIRFGAPGGWQLWVSVRDASSSRHGKNLVARSGPIELQTRSGNAALDMTWSDWARVTDRRRAFPVPRKIYQWRAILKGARQPIVRLDWTTLAWLPARNVRRSRSDNVCPPALAHNSNACRSY